MHLHRTVRIDAPPAAVWRCLTDAALRPRWLRNLVSEEIDDPDRRGVGTAATVRIRQNGAVHAYRSTVVEYDEGRRLSVGMTGGPLPPDAALGVRYDMAPGDGVADTVLDYDFQFPLTSLVLKLMYPLIRVGAGKSIDDDLAALKSLAESLSDGLAED